MVMTFKIIGFILVILGAISVYGAKFIIRKTDTKFDLENNAEYSYKKLAMYKIAGFFVTLAGIILALIFITNF